MSLKCLSLVTVTGCLLLLSLPAVARADDWVENAGVRITEEEVLFFSALAGEWTRVRLDLGERVQLWGAAGNVAAVTTSKRVLGFSAPLNAVSEIRLPITERVMRLQVRGNFASVSTPDRALAFSALTGEWSEAAVSG